MVRIAFWGCLNLVDLTRVAGVRPNNVVGVLSHEIDSLCLYLPLNELQADIHSLQMSILNLSNERFQQVNDHIVFVQAVCPHISKASPSGGELQQGMGHLSHPSVNAPVAQVSGHVPSFVGSDFLYRTLTVLTTIVGIETIRANVSQTLGANLKTPKNWLIRTALFVLHYYQLAAINWDLWLVNRNWRLPKPQSEENVRWKHRTDSTVRRPIKSVSTSSKLLLPIPRNCCNVWLCLHCHFNYDKCSLISLSLPKSNKIAKKQ